MHVLRSSPSELIAAATTSSSGAEWVPLIGGAVLVVVGLSMQLRTRRILATWHRSAAVVTANVRRSVAGSHDLFPVFTFTTAQGMQASVQQASNRPRFEVGERVDVLHDPRDPNSLRADRWVSMYLAPAVLLIAGSIALAITPLLVL